MVLISSCLKTCFAPASLNTSESICLLLSCSLFASCILRVMLPIRKIRSLAMSAPLFASTSCRHPVMSMLKQGPPKNSHFLSQTCKVALRVLVLIPLSSSRPSCFANIQNILVYSYQTPSPPEQACRSYTMYIRSSLLLWPSSSASGNPPSGVIFLSGLTDSRHHSSVLVHFTCVTRNISFSGFSFLLNEIYLRGKVVLLAPCLLL